MKISLVGEASILEHHRYLSITRPHIRTIAIVLILGLLSGCQTVNPISKNPTSSPATSPKIKVVVTNTILCDLTNQIAANTIDLLCLLPPGSDPHIYKLTPAARQSIEDAKLVLYGGYNLEPELTKAIQSTSNPAPKIAVNEVAVPQPQQFAEDGKSTIDPHVWHNARNAIEIAKVIEANLAKLVPNQARIYQQNTKKLTLEITSIDVWIRSQINTIPVATKILVTTHDALGYYSTAYGIPIATLGGVSTEEKPNAARAKELIEQINKTKVPTIYAELTLNPNLIKTIAKAANVKVSDREIYADGLGEVSSAGGTYQQMLISNTQAIVEGLGGKYSRFVNKTAPDLIGK
jgi:manganese/iron transport system substrate-binding protein